MPWSGCVRRLPIFVGNAGRYSTWYNSLFKRINFNYGLRKQCTASKRCKDEQRKVFENGHEKLIQDKIRSLQMYS